MLELSLTSSAGRHSTIIGIDTTL